MTQRAQETVFQLWQLAAHRARVAPDDVAIVGPDETLTYGELEALSNRLGHYLAARGVGPGRRVGILLTKGALGPAVMHGVMKAGAAYVPIDPRAPMSRAAFIVGDCALDLVVTQRRFWTKLVTEEAMAGIPVLLTDADTADEPGVDGWATVTDAGEDWEPPRTGTENAPAYILYTSGSTGRPKGVVISHRNALAFVDWAGDAFRIGPSDRASNHAPHHFDLSVLDLYATFKGGGQVHVVPDRLAPFPTALAEWIERSGITVWYSVPSALIRLLKQGGLDRFDYTHLRTVLFAGEEFPVKYLKDVMAAFPQASFHNLYGPTETNVITWQPVPRPLPDWDAVPLGKACANTDVFPVKEDGELAGPGEEGELWSVGPTTTLGYWNRPEETDRALVPDPRVRGHRSVAYRTGDLVRVEEDGVLRFIGRRDHMVKVRGYRVELGEVERALLRNSSVTDAIVVTEPDTDFGNRLAAFVVMAAGETVSEEDLKTHCLGILPRYAVPVGWTFLEDLPRTSTGKADRVALSRMHADADSAPGVTNQGAR